MTTVIAPLTARHTWKALTSHHKQVRELHLRKLFADDPTRGERLTAEAAGIYLDYSKNRITGETLTLLLQLAEESGLRARIDAMFRGDKINITEDRAVLHVALRAPRGTRSTPCSTRWRTSATASVAAPGWAIPASAYATSSTSALAAPTSGR
jgi:glucose-6-phosphate isomerase